MNSMKMQKDRTLKDELPRSAGAQYDMEKSGDITPERLKRQNQSKKKKTKKKTTPHPVLDMSGNGSCKEQYHIGTWNARSMNQGKSEVVKQEIARMKH